MNLFILIVFVAQCYADMQEYGSGQRKYKNSNQTNLLWQKNIFRLFNHINSPKSLYEDHQKIANEYSIEQNAQLYDTDVGEFVKLYKNSMLLKPDEIFSVFNEKQLHEAILLFKLLYYSKKYETFYETAVWARNHMNFGLFSYAFSVALTHRNDTYYLILPPIHEINPYYFFNEESIKEIEKNGLGNDDIIFANYSNAGDYKEHTKLNYYLEDIGFNSFYYYCNVYYPFWMDGEEFGLKNDRRGEQFYYLYQQLLARIHLERISNDIYEDIPLTNYDLPLDGYFNNLVYPNNISFPNREDGTFFNREGFNYLKIQDLERRHLGSVDGGYIFKTDRTLPDLTASDQTNLLGNLMESNPDSVNPNYYGPIPIIFRKLLKHSNPTVLHHFETALRDPLFYQLYKKLVMIVQEYKKTLPSYTADILNLPGVEITKVEFDRELITYFDTFDSDLSNIFNDIEPAQFERKIRQLRLNHVPFSYKIHVQSERDYEAVVRIYLGPKTNPLNLNENRMNFLEIDTFTHKIKTGANMIKCTSRQPYWYVPDRTSYRQLYRKIAQAVENSEELVLDLSEAFYGLPNRFLLPKGKHEGQVFQIYVILNEFKPPKKSNINLEQDFNVMKVGTGMNYVDDFAFGFPFDRVIKEDEFFVKNSFFQDIRVYHKNGTGINQP